jgi:isopropylmalate/homocitrate/citramalate synthase
MTSRAQLQKNLIYDWAEAGPRRFSATHRVELNDETLRDGLQSPATIDPAGETKVEILRLMDELGIETANVGLPGAGSRQRQATEMLCREIVEQRLRIRPNCAGRTVIADIEPMVELSQKTGVAVEACLFTGASPIRQYTESWSLEEILQRTRKAIAFAVGEGLPVMFVTEDTVRSSPEHLRRLLTAAVEEGARRVCLCDTVGGAIPEGVSNLVSWVKVLLDGLGAEVGIDWHGHRDRGLDMANTLAAIQAGASRVHGTAMGLGERAGNTPMEQILVNLKLLGLRDDDLHHLPQYVETVSQALGVPLPINAPVVGRNAFRTATGVHAAALIKAMRKGDAWLADWVYSGVPASWMGRDQEIEVGFMSGASNVIYYLESRGLPHGDEVVEAVLAKAKQSARLLTEEDIRQIVAEVAPGAA